MPVTPNDFFFILTSHRHADYSKGTCFAARVEGSPTAMHNSHKILRPLYTFLEDLSTK